MRAHAHVPNCMCVCVLAYVCEHMCVDILCVCVLVYILCTCSHTVYCMWECACLCGARRLTSGVFLHDSPSCLPRRFLLLVPRACWHTKTSWPVCFRDPKSLLLKGWDHRLPCPPNIPVGAGGSTLLCTKNFTCWGISPAQCLVSLTLKIELSKTWIMPLIQSGFPPGFVKVRKHLYVLFNNYGTSFP